MENELNNIKLDQDKEKAEFRSLWEERTEMIFEVLELTKKGLDSETKDELNVGDVINCLKENSEDIAKLIFTAFYQDSVAKVPDEYYYSHDKNIPNHKGYYYSLLKKSHPIQGIPLNTEEDLWMRSYTSISMFTRILKDNITNLKDYIKYVNEKDIVGQNITWGSLMENIKSITGFLKTMGNTWDVITLDEKLEVYLRNIQKVVMIIEPDVLIEQIQISKEIADILFDGMVKWQET